MKKLLVVISLVLSLVLVFSACKKDEEDDFLSEGYSSGEVFGNGGTVGLEPVDPNALISVVELKSFFVGGSYENLGPEYSQFFNIARRDNYVIRPLMAGVDISEIPEYASIAVTPPTEEGQCSFIVYYYTDGVYNAIIKVYYLTDEELSVSKTGGYHALLNGDEKVVQRENYGNFTIVNHLPDQTSYAEICFEDKYFITVQGGSINNPNYRTTIEKALLDILTFEALPLNIE